MVSPPRERLDLLIVAMIFVGQSFGNEYMMTCSRPVASKTPRLFKLDLGLPCDLSVESWCNLPGEKYPWHAVRSFVFENQGLMRRMYGEVRQLSVLRMEFNGNSIDESSSVGREFDELFKPVSPTTTTTSTTPKTTSSMSSSSASTTGSPKTTISSPSTSFSTSAESFSSSSSHPPTSASSPDLQSDKNNRSVSGSVDGDGQNDNNSSSSSNNESEDSGSRGEESVIKSTDFIGIGDYSDQGIQTTTTEEPGGGPEGTTLFDQRDVDTSGETAEVTTEPVHILFQDAERTTKSRPSTTTAPTPLTDNNPEDAESPQQIHRSDIKGVNACPVKEEVVAPYWANNTRGEVLALLNLYPFEQYIHWEKCTFEHRQMYCREGCRCEQQYRLHRLLAFDPTNECRGIFSDWFRFPSCCVCKCYLTSSDLAQERFSFNRSPRFDDTDVPDVNGVDDSHFYYKTTNFFNLRQPR